MCAKRYYHRAGKKGSKSFPLPGRSFKYLFQGRGKGPRLLGRKLNRSKKMAQAIKKSEARNKAFVEIVPGGLFLFNREGICLECQGPDEQQLRAMCRAKTGEVDLAGKPLQAIFNPAAVDALLKGLKNVFRDKELQVVEFICGSANQKTHFEARLVPSGREEVLALVREVKAGMDNESPLQHLKLHDTLTGLYSRAYFEDELKRLDGGRDYPVAIISAHLDDLQLVNDAFGYETADHYLVAAARILKESVRFSDILARVGGDEFALILPRTVYSAGEQLMVRIRRHIEDYNRKHSTLPIIMAMGIACSESQNKPLQEAYREVESLVVEDKKQRSIKAQNEIVRAVLSSFFFRDKKTEKKWNRCSN